MNPWFVVGCCLVIIGLLGSIVFSGWRFVSNDRAREKAWDQLFEQVKTLQADNRALMEALARKSQAPLIFTRQEIEKSSSWWETRPPESQTITQQ